MTVAALGLAASATSFCARHYTTTGVVLAVKPPATVTVSHDPFPGYMDAMAMPFELRGRAARVPLAPGDRIRLRLAVKGRDSFVDRVDVISAEPVDAGLRRTPA